MNRRLTWLTDVRAEYSNVANQVEQRRSLVEEAHRNLSQAQAAFTAATASSILSRMDLPDGGLHPVSPSRTMIGLGGLLASVLGGIGVVFLTAPVKRREDRLTLAEAMHAEAPCPLRRTARREAKMPRAEAVAVGEDDA